MSKQTHTKIQNRYYFSVQIEIFEPENCLRSVTLVTLVVQQSCTCFENMFIAVCIFHVRYFGLIVFPFFLPFIFFSSFSIGFSLGFVCFVFSFFLSSHLFSTLNSFQLYLLSGHIVAQLRSVITVMTGTGIRKLETD